MKRATLLDGLNDLRDHDLRTTYEAMVNDHHVLYWARIAQIAREPEVSYEKFVDYITDFRLGIEYASKAFGEEALASRLHFPSTVTNDRTKEVFSDLIAFLPGHDMVAVTFLHIATRCRLAHKPRALLASSRLPQGVFARPHDYTTLQAIEVCYYRLQWKQEKLSGVTIEEQDHHPLDHEIWPIWQRAALELEIKFVFDDMGYEVYQPNEKTE